MMDSENSNQKLLKIEEQAKLSTSKKVIVFDLDGTLAQSKMPIDEEMADLLCGLLAQKAVAIIGGGLYALFQYQVISRLDCGKNLLENLVLLPTSGASFFKFKNGSWHAEYQNIMSLQERERIKSAIAEVLKDINYADPKETYGPIVEDRETQVTFSALGMEASLDKKQEWNNKDDRREDIKKALEKHIPEFEIRLGGLTSIDITKKGINKAYGISQIMKALLISRDDVVYVGDALYKGGNDATVLDAGVDVVKVSDPEETKHFIKSLLA